MTLDRVFPLDECVHDDGWSEGDKARAAMAHTRPNPIQPAVLPERSSWCSAEELGAMWAGGAW